MTEIQEEEFVQPEPSTNLAEHMTFNQFIMLRNREDGFIAGDRGIPLGTYHFDHEGHSVFITGRTGEVFFNGEINTEWYECVQVYYRDVEFRELDDVLDHFFEKKERQDAVSSKSSEEGSQQDHSRLRTSSEQPEDLTKNQSGPEVCDS